MRSNPVVSVCVAAYNGERFIAMQLCSILSQLSAEDEVIVADDGSSDATCDEVLALNDPRIVLIRSVENHGILRNFETALLRSRADVVFLSDQDDLWMPGKVETILRAFNDDPELALMASDAILIDGNGCKIADSYYAARGKFCPDLVANIVKCRYLGCTMALRSTLLRKALPFPRTTQVNHDVWIGCVNALTGGRTKYIAEPLVAYRRHSANVTGRVKLGVFKRFRMRVHLIMALLAYSRRLLAARLPSYEPKTRNIEPLQS